MASTLTLTPGPSVVDGPGAGATAEPPLSPSGVDLGALLARIGRGDYQHWLRHVMPAAACARPVRLRVEAQWLNANGRLEVDPVSTAMPDGVLYVACKNRRASVCSACSATYRADMYHLINTGLIGGKGVPASVVEHPCLFLTLTAPSFGPVHTVSRPGQPRLCRPRRTAEHCPHGVELACWASHSADDPRAGQPLCLDCYDHSHHVVWNLHAGELWRRTTIAINRGLTQLADARGVKVRLSYAKVAEYQHRGVIHFHAMIRLDGQHPNDPAAIVAPHPAITTGHLESVIADALIGTGFTTEPHHRNPAGWPITWGQQHDLRRVQLSGNDLADDGQITTTAVAGYLAKYATKATEATGVTLTHRIRHPLELELYGIRGDTHQLRLLTEAWHLGGTPLSRVTKEQRQQWADTWGRLQRWAHMLGYGGHFATKSRRYSVTLTALRAIRKAFQRGQPLPPAPAAPLDHDQGEDDSITVIYTFDGIGWHTTADATLANTAAAKARERRWVARTECSST